MTLSRFACLRRSLPVLAALLAACALTPEQRAQFDAASQIKVDPTLFDAEPLAPTTRLPMPLLLYIPSAVPGAWAVLPYSPGAWMMGRPDGDVPVPRRIQAGAMVETALREVLQASLLGDVKTVSSMAASSENSAATLELVSLRFDYGERRLTWFPILIPFGLGFAVGQFEASTRLSIQLRLFDGQGLLAWARNYDDGAQLGVWSYPSDPDWHTGLQRIAHEAAWRLAQRALQDLREWHAGERTRLRTS